MHVVIITVTPVSLKLLVSLSLVTEIHVHEDYNSRIFANDIALYKLDKPLDLSKYGTPACLPSGLADDPVGGMDCKVAGWGDLS